MLKKLVKYGNSNAIIFDKAILELLNIKEGSLLKIKTDGTSLIITPQEKVTEEAVSETLTHHDFLRNITLNNLSSHLASSKLINASSDKRKELVEKLRQGSTEEVMQTLKEYPSLFPQKQQELMEKQQKEMRAVHEKHSDTLNQLGKIINTPDFQHEMQLLVEKYAGRKDCSAEFVKEQRDIMAKFIPEIREFDKDLLAVAKKYEADLS